MQYSMRKINPDTYIFLVPKSRSSDTCSIFSYVPKYARTYYVTQEIMNLLQPANIVLVGFQRYGTVPYGRILPITVFDEIPSFVRPTNCSNLKQTNSCSCWSSLIPILAECE